MTFNIDTIDITIHKKGNLQLRINYHTISCTMGNHEKLNISRKLINAIRSVMFSFHALIYELLNYVCLIDISVLQAVCNDFTDAYKNTKQSLIRKRNECSNWYYINANFVTLFLPFWGCYRR